MRTVFFWISFQDLIKELKGELSGNLKECVKSLCMKPAEFDAEQLHNAMKVKEPLFLKLYVYRKLIKGLNQ